jgi:hypothetical protein
MARTRNGRFGKAVDELYGVWTLALCSAKAPTISAFTTNSELTQTALDGAGAHSLAIRPELTVEALGAIVALSIGTALALLFAAPLAAHSRGRAPYVPAPAPGVVLLSL